MPAIRALGIRENAADGLVWIARRARRSRHLERLVFFDLSFFKLLVLGVVALIIFGPERLPGMAAQAGRMVRELRRMADGARSELEDSLGPEFSQFSQQFDIADLNPKHFVRKHVMNELVGEGTLLGGAMGTGNGATRPTAPSPQPALGPGERPPYDAEAT
jgi:sec-independent protein translocase protein TatB